MTRTRTNSVLGPKTYYYHSGNLISTTQLPGLVESIEDGTHDLSKLGQSDCGGPMLLNRDKYEYKTYGYTSGIRSGSTFYVQSGNPAGRPPVITDSEIKGLGTTAIARTIPTSPILDGATLLGETISGGLPALTGIKTWKERARLNRAAGSEYLNYQFGWVPLLNDIRNFAYAVKNSHKVLEEFHEGSGKNTRVGYKFPKSSYNHVELRTINSVRADGVAWDSLPGYQQEISGSQTWFNGCFTYYVPVSVDTRSSIARFAADANKLFGVRVTPEVLWNISPWSWGMDWFGNVGDVLANMSALGSDGLVLKYGYVMYHNFYDVRRVQFPHVNNGGVSASSRRLGEVKKRFPASPYSYFAAPTSLSVKQSAILVALGLSKS
jgi:hypothetical protein